MILFYFLASLRRDLARCRKTRRFPTSIDRSTDSAAKLGPTKKGDSDRRPNGSTNSPISCFAARHLEHWNDYGKTGLRTAKRDTRHEIHTVRQLVRNNERPAFLWRRSGFRFHVSLHHFRNPKSARHEMMIFLVVLFSRNQTSRTWDRLCFFGSNHRKNVASIVVILVNILRATVCIINAFIVYYLAAGSKIWNFDSTFPLNHNGWIRRSHSMVCAK